MVRRRPRNRRNFIRIIEKKDTFQKLLLNFGLFRMESGTSQRVVFNGRNY